MGCCASSGSNETPASKEQDKIPEEEKEVNGAVPKGNQEEDEDKDTSRSKSTSPRRGGDSSPRDKQYRKYTRHASSIASTVDSNPQAYGPSYTREATFSPRREADYASVRRSHKVYDSLPADLKVIMNHPHNLHGRPKSYYSRGATPRPESSMGSVTWTPLTVWGPDADDDEDEERTRSTTPWHEEKMEQIAPKYAPLKRRKPYIPAHLLQKVKIHDVTKKHKKSQKRDKS